jgi:glycerol-3-phosphate dehydrogenase
VTTSAADKTFDILVIGGGIHGASIAWEATLRGFSVCLVEKGDFSSGASAGNYRIIHGGLRYLQHLDLMRLFESVEEQRVFRKIVPAALKPLPFIIPCYGYGLRGRELLKLGLSFYDLLTCRRNRKINPALHLPNHQLLATEELQKIAPYLDTRGLRGGIVYSDVQMLDPDRVGLAFVRSAANRGAVALNYTEAVTAELGGKSDKIESVLCRDLIGKEEFSIKARVVINAAGSWRELVNRMLLNRAAPKFLFSKGLQITLPALTGDYAIALESRYRDKNAFVSKGNRSYFLQPWRGKTIAGTADILHTEEPDRYRLNEEETSLFLEELKALYPDPLIKRENVSAVFGGLRPVSPKVETLYQRKQLGDYGSIEVAHRDTVIVHGREKERIENLISVEGIKYTTTRRLAQRVIDEFERVVGEKRGESRSKEVPLDYSEAGHSSECIKRAIESEFVRRPEDLLERRLGFGAYETPPTEVRRLVEEVWAKNH